MSDVPALQTLRDSGKVFIYRNRTHTYGLSETYDFEWVVTYETAIDSVKLDLMGEGASIEDAAAKVMELRAEALRALRPEAVPA